MCVLLYMSDDHEFSQIYIHTQNSQATHSEPAKREKSSLGIIIVRFRFHSIQ